MKVSKFRIAVLGLLAVTVVYAVMFALNLWNYCQIPTEGYDPILGHWYGNPKPFNVTPEGQKFSAVGITLFFTWFAVAWISLGREQKESSPRSARALTRLIYSAKKILRSTRIK